jgi:oligosaccharide repeat unit polymerase
MSQGDAPSAGGNTAGKALPPRRPMRLRAVPHAPWRRLISSPLMQAPLVAGWLLLVHHTTGLPQLTAFCILPALSVFTHLRTVADPLCLFTLGFIMYSVSFPLCHYADIYRAKDTIVEEVVTLHAYAYAAFLFGTALARRVSSHVLPRRNAAATSDVPAVLLALLVLLTGMTLYDAWSRGYDSKQEFKAAAAGLQVFGAFFYPLIYLTVLKVNTLCTTARPKAAALLTVGIAAYLVVAFGFTGERDLLFFFLGSILVYANDVRRRLTGPQFLALFALSLIAVPFLHATKNFLTRQSFDFAYLHEAGVSSIFSTEFLSAGRNLYFVLDQFIGEPLGGSTFLWDVQRIFNSNLLGIRTSQSATEWFNNIFLENTGAGKGFSLIAEGYINFGILGVVVVFAALGAILAHFFRRRMRSPASYVVYLAMLLTSIYSLRADLSFLIGAILKSTVIPLLALRLWNAMMPNHSAAARMTAQPSAGYHART